MTDLTNYWTCPCGALWTGEFARVLKFCGNCGKPRSVQVEAPQVIVPEEDRRAAWELLHAGKTLFKHLHGIPMPPWEDLPADVQATGLCVLAKAREFLCRPVDREGLAKALGNVLTNTMEVIRKDELNCVLADAAIAYIGARPADTTTSKNWELAYDKVCRERDELRRSAKRAAGE